MERDSLPSPSVIRDLLISAFIAILIISGWLIIYFYGGEPSKLNNNSINFIGAVLAVSGLLFRQYMLKEVLDYLKSWDRMSNLLGEIIELSNSIGKDKNNEVAMFKHQKEHADEYGRYVRRELNIVPIVPMLVIFLYGCAMVSEKLLWLRLLFLYGMIHSVSYLMLVALTSSRIACSYPNLDDTIKELETLREDLQ